MSFYDLKDLVVWLITALLNSKLFVPIVVVFVAISIYVINKFHRQTRYASISDINVFNITIKLDMKNIDVAYMMYIELSTRKIGIEFEEDDVIIEVYNSWYSAFKTIRELLLRIRPIPKNKELIEVGESILNVSLRPHLTKWQAKFRRWYDTEQLKDENKGLSPQEIQRKYPYYNELVSDLKISHQETLKFIGALEKIFK